MGIKNNTTLIKILGPLGLFTGSMLSSCESNYSISEPTDIKKTWVDKVSDDRINSLNFQIDENTGEVLKNDRTQIEQDDLFNIILKTCNDSSVQTVFLGDCDHTKTQKHQILINSLKPIKDNAFSLAIEDDEKIIIDTIVAASKNTAPGEKVLMDTVIVSVKDMTLEELQKNKSKIIAYFEATSKNPENSLLQAESSYDLIEKAKQTELNLYFCENIDHGINIDWNMRDLRELFDKEIETEKNKNLNTDATLKKRDIVGSREFSSDADVVLRDITMELPAEKMLIYRGAGHMYGRADLNEYPQFGKSVTIWNLNSPEDLMQTIQVLLSKWDRMSETSSTLDTSLLLNKELKERMTSFRDMIKPEQNRNLDLPDYVMIYDEKSKGTKLYETTTYLKTHTIDKNWNIIERDKNSNTPSLHDYLFEAEKGRRKQNSIDDVAG